MIQTIFAVVVGNCVVILGLIAGAWVGSLFVTPWEVEYARRAARHLIEREIPRIPETVREMNEAFAAVSTPPDSAVIHEAEQFTCINGEPPCHVYRWPPLAAPAPNFPRPP